MGLPKCVMGRPMWRRMEPIERASPRPTRPHAVTHPLPPRLIIFSHPHIPTQTPHTQKISPGASIPSPLAYTHSREWNLLSWRHIRLSLSRPLSFLVLSLPCPPVGPSIHASLEYVIHTYLSRPHQMHQLHIHTCYITYPHWSKKPSLHVYFAYNIPFE